MVKIGDNLMQDNLKTKKVNKNKHGSKTVKNEMKL